MSEADFLVGGGEMGALVRGFDWESHPLGTPARWPQSLRSAVSICLGSRFPIVLWWGPELFLIYNDAYGPMLGVKHPGALGQPGRACWPEIWHIIGPMLEGTVLENGEATWSDDQLLVLERHGYAEECYFTFTYSPIRDESGGVGGVFCAVIETTDRVIGERRLRLLKDLAAATLHSSDAEEACRRAAHVIGHSPQDLSWAAIYLFDGETGHLVARTASGSDRALPARITRKDGESSIRTMSTHTVPIAAATQEQPVGLFVCGLNPQRPFDDDYRSFVGLVAGHIASAVADARALEAEHARAEALAEIDRAKTTFFSNVSHEFRTPLTLMLGPLEDALADDRMRAATHRQLEVAHRNSLRLLKLVNSLLDFSRIEAGRIHAVYEPVDLARLTTEIASVFRSAFERAGVEYVVRCPHLAEPVYVDRDMWEKVVLNLVSNAFKFTFDGRVEVALAQEGDGVGLTVRDTGTGIPAHELPRVFERFHRVASARGRSYEGTGIGLALVRELVRLHGGTVAIASEEGKGSTFTVAIPRGRAHLPAERVHESGIDAGHPERSVSTAVRVDGFIEEALRWLPDGHVAATRRLRAARRVDAPAANQIAASPARILVADDNADLREYVRHLLCDDYEVETVANGTAALRSARERVPDLVLTDVMMPGLDGFGLLREIRADERLRTVPVIMLSARAGEESRVEGLDAGADDYLTKPFSARELLARVGAHVSLARARREAEETVRRSAERNRFLVTLEDATRSLTDPIAIGAAAAEVLAHHLGASRAYWVDVEDGEHVIARAEVRRRETTSAIGGSPTARLTEHLEDLRNGHPVVQDVAADPLVLQDGGPEVAAGSEDHVRIAVPVIRASRLRAALSVERARSRPWTASEVALVEEAAQRAWNTIERAHVDAALRESEERFRVALEIARLGTWSWDPRRNEVHADVRCREICFLDQTAPLSLADIALRVHPGDWPGVDAALQRALASSGDGRCAMEFRFVNPPDRVHWVSAQGQALFSTDTDGRKPTVMLGSVLDITARKENEAELRAASQMKDEFLATLSHELRTPLNAVLGWAHLLRSGNLRAELRERAFDALETNARAQAQLVDDLLDVSRIVSGKLQVRREIVDVSTIVASALEAVRPAAVARRIALQMSEVPGPDLVVIGDENRLRQIVLNLLTNGIKFTEPGGRVDVSLRHAGSMAEIAVRDTGQGIAPEFLPFVFDRFRQADNSTTRGHGGLGLGLAIARHLTEAHGGTAAVESDGPGKGATFTIRLPLHEDRQGARTVGRAADIKPLTALSGTRVLVVDDEQDARELIALVLETAGAVVTTATSVGEAQSLVGQRAFDVLVVDIGMPHEDGYSLLQAIRQMPQLQLQRIPALAVTAYAAPRDRERALAAGFDCHLPKPVDPHELVEAVASVLRAV